MSSAFFVCRRTGLGFGGELDVPVAEELDYARVVLEGVAFVFGGDEVGCGGFQFVEGEYAELVGHGGAVGGGYGVGDGYSDV